MKDIQVFMGDPKMSTSGLSSSGQVVNYTNISFSFMGDVSTNNALYETLTVKDWILGRAIEEESDISELLINDPYFRESVDRARKEMSEGIYLTHEEVFGF